MQRGDHAALRGMWTAEGDYVDASGKVTKAKDLFPESARQPATEVPQSEVTGWESSLRFITPEVAIEDGILESGARSDGSTVSHRFSVVWVKRDGQWLIDSLREATSSSPSIHDRLSPLSWLVGEWAAQTKDGEILVSAHWSDQGKYLIRDFVVRGEGREPISGTERIGWDPAAKKIKSWMFDSQGGAGEGYWRRDGEQWVVEAVETMPDGNKAETSLIYMPTKPGQFMWEVARSQVADEKLPAQRIEFNRAAE